MKATLEKTTPSKPRTKRSWSRVTVQIGPVKQTFWPTPEGLHVRRKGSPKVQTCAWAEMMGAIQGDHHEFEHDGRTYEVWRGEEGIHIRRGGHEEHVVKWAQFIEFVDGQKLLPL